MKAEEKKVIRSYVEAKLSEQQIAERFSLSPSRVRWIIKKNKIAKRSISEAIRYLNITKYGKEVFQIRESLTSEQEKLKIAGVMLYWGEGTKGGGTVSLHNSDPKMVKVFLRFLREICGIRDGRLRATLHAYPDQNILEMKKFWSVVTDIPLSRFHEPYIHRNTKGSYKKKSQYGTLAVVYSDKLLLETINRWIAEYSALFVKGQHSSVGRAAHL